MTTDPRIELAAKAIRSQIHTRNEVTMAVHALAAADTVDPLRNPSETDIERASEVLHEEANKGINPFLRPDELASLGVRSFDAHQARLRVVRAVVAALRGDVE